MKLLFFNNCLTKNINYIDIAYKDVLLKDKGNKLLIEFDLNTSPDSPIKYISIGVTCLNSYSDIDWRRAPQGGIGDKVGLESDAAVIAMVNIFASG